MKKIVKSLELPGNEIIFLRERFNGLTENFEFNDISNQLIEENIKNI